MTPETETTVMHNNEAAYWVLGTAAVLIVLMFAVLAIVGTSMIGGDE